MKLRWEYNISKQFQSISCLTVWLRAHFPPSKMLIWGKISIFDTKNLISRYFTTFQLPNHLHLQKMSKIQLYSYGKIQAKQIWLLKYTKTCPKLAVLGYFLIFSVFDVNFLRTLNPKSALLFIKCGIKYPKWPIYAKSVHKTELSNLTKNEIVLRPKHGAPPVWTMLKKTALFLHEGFPNKDECDWLWLNCTIKCITCNIFCVGHSELV